MGTQSSTGRSSFSDEPVTPSGRLLLQRDMNTIIHGVVGFKDPIDVPKSKEAIMSSIMVQHPRFRSLLVRDERGVEHWRRTTHIDIDRHFIVVEDAATSVEDYLADLSVSSPLSEEKPLWEVHALLSHKCGVFRIHHALGDGVSIMSMLFSNCRLSDDPEAIPTVGHGGGITRSEGAGGVGVCLVGFVKMIFFSLVFVFELVMRALWVSDRRTPISGGAGVELWPRKLATASFSLDDLKTVKKSVAGGTINDVLFAVVSSGLSRYLEHRSPNALREGLRISGLAMVNVRQRSNLQELLDLMKGSGGSGIIRRENKFGMIMLPVYHHKGGGEPLACLKRAKRMIDRKKLTLEAHFSHIVEGLLMSWFGPKVACLINYRIFCNTSFTISNIVGPREEITLAGNLVTYMRANTTCLPHALTMVIVSYAGRADMQILVAKDIIPDPEFLAECFEDALLEMKEATFT